MHLKHLETLRAWHQGLLLKAWPYSLFSSRTKNQKRRNCLFYLEGKFIFTLEKLLVVDTFFSLMGLIDTSVSHSYENWSGAVEIISSLVLLGEGMQWFLVFQYFYNIWFFKYSTAIWQSDDSIWKFVLGNMSLIYDLIC